MRKIQALFVCAALAASSLLLARSCAAQTVHSPVVRVAELQIDPAQLDAYIAALKEEIETSIRVEPGVLMLYAVSVRNHPEQIRLFERYRDDASYQAHLQTAHFKRYKASTERMVKSLTLIETEPVLLGAKPDMIPR